MRIRITLNTDTFHAVLLSTFRAIFLWKQVIVTIKIFDKFYLQFLVHYRNWMSRKVIFQVLGIWAKYHTKFRVFRLISELFGFSGFARQPGLVAWNGLMRLSPRLCSELIKTQERRHRRRYGGFIVNFEHISHFFWRFYCCFRRVNVGFDGPFPYYLKTENSGFVVFSGCTERD